MSAWYAVTYLNIWTPDTRMATCYYSTAERAMEGMRLRYPRMDDFWFNLFATWLASDLPAGAIYPTEYWVAMRIDPQHCDRPYIVDRQ